MSWTPKWIKGRQWHAVEDIGIETIPELASMGLNYLSCVNTLRGPTTDAPTDKGPVCPDCAAIHPVE